MGAGRKPRTFSGGSILHASPNLTINSGYGRNLGKNELGGIIFGCKNSTMKECLSKQLFGLPANHFSYVRNIAPGLPLFLFNYSDRKLHGIFEACSQGKMYIDPYAWIDDFSEITPYPAQVKIRVRLQCRPLLEEKFGQVIADNYYRNKHFWFELDHRQTSKLVFSLTSLAIAPGTPVPWRNRSRTIVSPSLPSQETWKKREAFETVERDIENFTDRSRRNFTHYITSSLEGDIESLETCRVEREVKDDEKNLIYMKLKEIALEWERQNVYSPDTVSDTDDENNVSYAEECYSEISTCLEEKEECHNLSFVDQYSIAQVDEVIQDVEELATFKEMQTHKNFYLKQNQMNATLEVQYLKDRCTMLETTFNLPLTQKKVIHPSSELYLDHKEPLFLGGGFEGESRLSAMDLFCPSWNVIKIVKSVRSVHSNALLVHPNAESSSSIPKEWTLWTSLNQNKEPLAGVSLNNNVFSIGANGVDCFSKVDMLDSGRWISLPSILLDKRFDLATAEPHGSPYATGTYNRIDYLKFALGGFDGCTNVPSIKVIDPCHGALMIVKPMNHLREYSVAPISKESICVTEGVKGVDEIEDRF